MLPRRVLMLMLLGRIGLDPVAWNDELSMALGEW